MARRNLEESLLHLPADRFVTELTDSRPALDIARSWQHSALLADRARQQDSEFIGKLSLSPGERATMAPYPQRLDHIVLVTRTVEETVEDLQRRLGVAFHPGGRHLRWSTRNAILPIGPAAYLEVIGPDSLASASAATPRLFGIDTLASPGVATWAAKGTRLLDLVALAKAQGLDLGSVEGASRVQPDGTVLEWELTDPFAPREGGVIPFLIQWHTGRHPATAAPIEVTVAQLFARHPDPDGVGTQLRALGLELDVERGSKPELITVLRTRDGLVTLPAANTDS